ncbi:MAG: hypothetical protein NWQ57_10420 [Paraglaciecola sp.]|nr:hypothetical protein [Paraglaciecola sp.]
MDGKYTLISESQSIYIPLRAIHALKNLYKIPLELTQVQSGSDLVEDDIVHLRSSSNTPELRY